jgi:D-xylose transport system ATP-binding protein
MRTAVSVELPLLECRGVSKCFGAVQALWDVDFSVSRGEVVALVGDNGAGKSTLVKIISGIYQPDSGGFSFDGQPGTIRNPHDAVARGISTVYQDLALCDNLDAVANLFLGREWTRGVRLSKSQMEKRAVELLDSLQIRLPSVHSPVASLSGGQRQSVAVARAVLSETARVVVLDEPTAALGVSQTKMVLDLVRTLREKGHGVVLISHNLAEVVGVADRIVVLRLGRNAAEFRRGASSSAIVAAITGADVAILAEEPELSPQPLNQGGSGGSLD